MAERDENNGPARFLRPAPLLAGVVCSFLGCCAAGWIVSDRNPYRDFIRFHQGISIETDFFPTASQVRALGRSGLDPDQVLVVVGSNSVLYGWGQDAQEVWTRRLQEELGGRFHVVNLAMRGSYPAEFGEAAAEMLERDHPKLLFITHLGAAGEVGDPDGKAYRYFYWDAFYKGLIPSDKRREERLGELAKARTPRGDPGFVEMQRGRRLDATLRYQDLWTTIAYEYVFTMWTPLGARNFTQPHGAYVDPTPPRRPSLEERYDPATNDREIQIVGGLGAAGRAAVKGPPGESPLARGLRECFPEAGRKRTLVLLIHDSPHYLMQLPEADQKTYAEAFPGEARVLEEEGLTPFDVGDYSELDYYDRCHLCEQGARRLAHDAAPKVREMAGRLGYLPEGGNP